MGGECSDFCFSTVVATGYYGIRVMRGLRVPAFVGSVREPAVLCVRGGMRNSLCGQWNVEPKHMNLITSKFAKHVDVPKFLASIALRTEGLHCSNFYIDVTTHCCETLAHTLAMR